MPPFLAALLARLPGGGLAGIRKVLVTAAGTAAVAAVAELGPSWAVAIPIVLSVVGVYWAPNDTDGDGKITVVDYVQAVAGLVIDQAAAQLADRVAAAAPTVAIPVVPAEPPAET